ncbi:MAG TPA: DUF2946 family protein [Caulobacteraceae bacterium]|jgi:hypothetical protein|nr:DUF2946 family protein [Caulobacteraceae bacterium]
MRPAGRIFALPLLLLALLLQAGAGIAATRAQADGANPFAAIPVCSPDKAKAGHGGQTPGAEHGDHHCGACLLGAAATPPLLAGTQLLIPGGLNRVATPALARHVQPRGPPGRAPKARGPPAFA